MEHAMLYTVSFISTSASLYDHSLPHDRDGSLYTAVGAETFGSDRVGLADRGPDE